MGAGKEIVLMFGVKKVIMIKDESELARIITEFDEKNLEQKELRKKVIAYVEDIMNGKKEPQDVAILPSLLEMLMRENAIIRFPNTDKTVTRLW